MNDAPKSAYELAMERLRKKDAAEGVTEKALTAAQKAAIAEARSVYEARVAERQILFDDAMRKAGSADEVEKLEAEFRRDKERYGNDRDAKIAQIRESS